MEIEFLSTIKDQLNDRKARLEETIQYVPDPSKLYGLLKQVDAALKRIDNGTYGICEVCNDTVEADRLLIDPLITVCLGHMNEMQQHALENDLELAAKIQRGLLPKNNLKLCGWEFGYHYSPMNIVGGDFCDVIPIDSDSILFILGDVSGKGISASLMTSHLHALVKSLIYFKLPLNEMITKANILFCESTISSNYATAVFGIAKSNGEVEICVAGHNPPLLVKDGNLITIDGTGIPIGLFKDFNFETVKFNLAANDFLLLYTDGLSEASINDIEYGEERIKKQVETMKKESPKNIIDFLLNDQKEYLADSSPSDDVTIAILRKS